jgi:outer membrane protein assembly factor BamB
MAISGNDLFVATYAGTVGEYTTAGTTVNTSLISGLSAVAQGGGGLEGLAVFGNDLFAGNVLADTIGEYTTSGSTVNASLISGLDGPVLGVAINPVPESSVGALTCLGAAMLWVWRRTKRITSTMPSEMARK